jgi:hypothetical protein
LSALKNNLIVLEMEQRNDEIDLLELSRNLMVRFYHYVLRRYKMLGIFTMVGAIPGIGFYFKDKNRFENTIIGTSYVVHPTVIVDIINSLQEINKSDKVAIGKFLNLNEEEANSLLGIEADTIQTIQTIDNQKLTTIEVKVKFKENLDLTGFSKHLCSYIDSNVYVKQELQLEKNKSFELINKYKEEIDKLDSLQRKILASKIETSGSQPGNLLILNDKANSFFHNDIISLETRKQNELKKIERITGFLIIDEKKGTKIKEVSLVGTIIKLMAIWFGIGFFVSIVLEFKRQVKFIELSKNE